MMVIGCDPGLTGAISLIKLGVLLECEDLPVCGNGTASGSMKRWIDVPRLWNLLADWSARHDFARENVTAVMERPIPMPSLPAQTIASQFDTFGAVRAVLTSKMREPMVCVNPSTWKKFYSISTEKSRSLEVARALYPNAASRLRRALDHNRAESILIGHWYMRTEA